MIISLIVAAAENNAIGKDNDLIWRLPADMKLFKETTTGHHIITGRKNYISIPPKFRPLPNRTNIVVTRDTSFKDEGAIICHSLKDAFKTAQENGEKEVFVIGGGEIYKQTLELADKIYLSRVHEKFEADTFFPKLGDEWILNDETLYSADEKNPHDFSFCIYERRK